LTIEQVRAGCQWQLEICRKDGTATYVALLTGLIERLGTDDAVTGLLVADGQDPIRSALCLRLFGAVNRIAMAHSASWISAYYPTLGGRTDTVRVVPAFFDFLSAHLDAVRKQMGTAVQTNEVGRAAPLSAAMNHVALTTNRPLRLLEVGASGGLNLLLDRYHVDGGGQSWGPPDSALRLAGHFASGNPRAAVLTVTERRGCDIKPIDVHDPGAATFLRSFVWPEHVERVHRLDAALDIARSAPRLRVDTADACSWVAEHAADPEPGRTTVVFHSIVLPYLDPAERARFTRLIRACGEAADPDRPFAWVALEPSDTDSSVVHLTCEQWPAHRRELLATTSPHGTNVRWAPRDLPA
jgi:hypothetical protein